MIMLSTFSAFSEGKAGKRCFELGAYAYFEKPFNPQELLHVH